MRIVFQIVQRNAIFLGPIKQLPPIVADGALVIHVCGEEMVAHLGLFAVNDLGQALALNLVGNRKTGQPAECRINVVKINQGIRRAFWNTSATGENLHARRVLEGVVFAGLPVAIHRHAVIGGEQDEGVFRLAGFLERIEHAADVMIEM